MSEKRINPLVLVIVCGIFALLLTTILVIGFGNGIQFGTSTAAKKEPPRDLTWR